MKSHRCRLGVPSPSQRSEETSHVEDALIASANEVSPGVHPHCGDGYIGVKIIPQPVDEKGESVGVGWRGIR